MLTATVPGSGGRSWNISYSVHQLVLSVVCITLVLHGIGVAATKCLGDRGPTPVQMGLYYYSSGFALIVYAAAVALIVRMRPSVPADLSRQRAALSCGNVCNTVVNGVLLVAACVGPPLFLFFLMSPVPAMFVLACLAVACALSAGVCWCWSCVAAALAAGMQAPPQFLSSIAGAHRSTQVLNPTGTAVHSTSA